MNSHTDPVSRVNRGVEHLNRHAPNWLDAMPEDLGELNINHDDCCIVGHVYGAGHYSIEMAGIYSERRAAHLGFMVLGFWRHPLAWFGDNRRLTDAWRQKIAALRGNLKGAGGPGEGEAR